MTAAGKVGNGPVNYSSLTKATVVTFLNFPVHVRKSIHLIAVAVVSDIGAGALPSNTFLRGSPLRIEEGSHTLRIQAAALHQVDDREAVGHSSLRVPDPEVKPLRVLCGVHVCAQGELILIDTPEQRRNMVRAT